MHKDSKERTHHGVSEHSTHTVDLVKTRHRVAKGVSNHHLRLHTTVHRPILQNTSFSCRCCHHSDSFTSCELLEILQYPMRKSCNTGHKTIRQHTHIMYNMKVSVKTWKEWGISSPPWFSPATMLANYIRNSTMAQNPLLMVRRYSE